MSPKKILIVDDHTDTRFICRELFTHFGYTVFEAADGVEAVDAAFTHLPDLVLLDFLMPHSDGIETVRNLRAHPGLDQTAIVLYTAAASHAPVLLGVPGVQRVLFKPVESADLLAAVQQLIGPAESEVMP